MERLAAIQHTPEKTVRVRESDRIRMPFRINLLEVSTVLDKMANGWPTMVKSSWVSIVCGDQ